MFLANLCIPALIYIVFSLTHIVVETFNKQYNKALLQTLLALVMTLLLQLLCSRGMNIISWIIVFIPFMFYTYTTMIIYYVFGLKPENVEITYKEEESEDDKNSK